jgi:hypothetical protein
MKKIIIKPSNASVWGVIPETLKFPVEITPGSELEKILLQKTAIHRICWNFFVQEANYRLDLKTRVKEGTALPEEGGYDEEKGKIVWDTKISAFGFNYLLTPYRNAPAFSFLKEVPVSSLRETARLVAGGFDSFFKLRKNGDKDARPPFYKDEETFQTIIWKDVILKKGRLLVEGIEIPIPKTTAQKIGMRKMAHVIIDRHESKLYLPSTWSVQCVLMDSPAPIPQPVKRIVALCFGSSGVAGIDSRGKAFFIKMRRPDLYIPRIFSKQPDGTFKKEKSGPTLRDLIGGIDVKITCMRENIKSFPKEVRAQKWRELELDPQYQVLKKRRAQWFDLLHNKQRDYHRKLADHLVHLGDCFFVGKPNVRSKDDAIADASDGNKEKNWNVQNTGSLSECIRLFQWACKKHGKIFMEVAGEHKVSEQEYRIRKVKQAREIFYKGLVNFSEAFFEHLQKFCDGYEKLLESEVTTEIASAHVWFATSLMWNDNHIDKIKYLISKCSFQNIQTLHVSAGKTKKSA